VIVCVRVE